ncbi:hypothetical protein GJ744_000614 [Endocarpon pusillum]|uniref:Uncharacterized protein n=1 Tax=Endocarpon pusillum TaxID=364733 RepID=A0A8H7AAI5_9EURO|nr:hypothetical protein GJ744_000614 [Endocarpon pusillum]
MDAECMAAWEEWRNDSHQISYCYVARRVEDPGKTELMDDELAEGLGSSRWMSVETALEEKKTCEPASELGLVHQGEISVLSGVVGPEPCGASAGRARSASQTLPWFPL